jgi:eukaryotic-like serine/threonine-protein kinase
MRAAQVLLFDRNAGHEQLDEGIRLCHSALGRYRVLENPSWRETPAVTGLEPAERDRLAEDVGDLLFLLAKATAQVAVDEAGRRPASGYPGPDARLRSALEINATALACYDGRGVPKAVWEQRAELSRLLGEGEETQRLLRKAGEAPERADKDGFLLGHLYAVQGNYRKALPHLRRATQQDPQSFVAWFVRGVCHLELLQDSEAVACFNSCVALRPDVHWAWYNRAQAHRRQRNFEQALADYDRVLALRPDFAKAYVSRALAREGLRDWPGAVADLTRSLEFGSPRTSVFFLRAAARAKAGDPAGAERDRAEGMRRQPTDETGWVDRGLARVASDPEGALADFEEALRLNPRSFRGLQNKAAILVDKFGRDAEALRVMDQAVGFYPDSVLARGGRGVLLARVGKRAQALQDAEEALLLDTSPATLYQAACVFALTSRQYEEDRTKALQLLSSALRKGYGLDLIDADKDLDPLRELPEYQRVVGAARSLQASNR